MNTPQATVISSFIVTAGLTSGIFFVSSPQRNYATVSYDGGYQKIGIIYSEQVFTKAELKKDGDSIVSGDAEKVIEFLKKDSEGYSLDSKVGKGILLTASSGIRWNASRTNFDLTTDNLLLNSSKERLTPNTIISSLNKLIANTKSKREETSESALTYGRDPNPDWISSLASAFR
tara:strand:- start:42 stop:566 length:525 start_codon:yes stop_codon:yes gene_type:complete